MRLPRRPAPAPDPYEGAADRLEEARRSREIGEPILRPPAKLGPMRPRKWPFLLLLLVVVVVAVARASHPAGPPKVAANCSRSELRLSTSSVVHGGQVFWAASGPRKADVVLWAGVARLVPAGAGRYRPVPLRGVPVANQRLWSDEITMVSCHAEGAFTAEVPAGRYLVSLFRLSGNSAPILASTRLTVTG